MLHKGAFQYALVLRYNWQPQRVPSTCGCGAKFSVEHALSCPKGGFPFIRHNEIRDLTANLLTQVCSDVCIEPELQPMTGEVLSSATSNAQDGARLDNGFWGGCFEWTFFDVRVFNPHAPSHRQSSLAACYRKQELLKNVPTNSESGRSNTPPSPPWSCLPLVAWQTKPLCSTKGWLHALL